MVRTLDRRHTQSRGDRAMTARDVDAMPRGPLDGFAADIVRRCRWAQQHNDGHPWGVWSTGEQLAVALVLRDRTHLEQMGYTVQQAAQRVHGGMASPPSDFAGWLDGIRAALQHRHREGSRVTRTALVKLACTACQLVYEPDPSDFGNGTTGCPRCGGWTWIADLVGAIEGPVVASADRPGPQQQASNDTCPDPGGHSAKNARRVGFLNHF